jgi:5'-phosphate synthase pdxT subunit
LCFLFIVPRLTHSSKTHKTAAMTQDKTIGVLALQGAVDLHRPHIEACGARFMAVKTPAHFAAVDGFILPGGESTTMLKLIENFGLWDVLVDEFSKKPVWGICAGSILMAQTVLNPAQKSFALMDYTIERNGYGTQSDSHHARIANYDVSLIRAPIIKNVASDIEVKASHKGDPVWITKGHYMSTSFHPEVNLQFPSPMHQAFIDLVA